MVQRTIRPGKHWLLLLLCLALCPAGGCKQGAWPLWDAYVAHFIDAQGRVIDHTSGDRTTSEGQAYAMFFALADNDRATFDRVLSWTQANLANNDLENHLPAWLWGQSERRAMEDAGSQSGIGCRCLDGLHAAGGGPVVECPNVHGDRPRDDGADRQESKWRTCPDLAQC